jgi:hypothetical protein
MSSEREVILLADDDENDIALFERAFQKADIKNPLHIVRDGEEAIAYLAGKGKFADRTRLANLHLRIAVLHPLKAAGPFVVNAHRCIVPAFAVFAPAHGVLVELLPRRSPDC